jgi:exonuclease III
MIEASRDDLYPDIYLSSDSEIENYEDEDNCSNNEFIGDIMDENKADDTTRIYVQNLNGITWDQEGGKWPSICDSLSAIHADIACFTELNQDVGQFAINQKMDAIGNRFFNHHRFVASTSARKVSNTYKPGGTGILVVEDTTGIVRSTSKDRMGRWATTKLQGTNGMTINVISAYQVCQSRTTGLNTAANQQISQLLEEAATAMDATRINPRAAFIRDLQNLINQQQTNGEQTILVGDFNEEIGSENSGMAQLATELGLVDLFSTRLGTAAVPSTYIRGHKRLDYALISPGILPSVKAAGYDPFSYRIQSDHRAFFIDFDTASLFGHKPSPIAPYESRDFNSKTPGTVVKYITAKMKELENHNFSDRIRRLNDLEQPDHEFAERLDRDMQRAAKVAAKQAKRKYKTPWSPAFAKAWAMIRFSKLCLSRLRNPTVDLLPSIAEWQRTHPELPTSLPDNLNDAKLGLQQALSALNLARQSASAARDDYLEAQAAMYDYLEEKGKAAVVRRLRKAEEIHRTYLKLQAIRRIPGSSGITELKVPIDPTVDPKECDVRETHWRTERVPIEIERLLIQRNRQHFGQAETDGTPFTQPAIRTELHYDGSGQVGDLILDGVYEPEALNDATKLFIKHLKRKSDTVLTGSITAEDFVGKIKRWPEKTSTSPSGFHLGHLHVLWRHHGLDAKDPKKAEVEAGQQFLIDAHVILLNYAMKFGYSFDRWQDVVNVMLMKEPGNPKIHRLRVIHLYEADYNLLLAVKWRQAMHHAEDSGFLNEGLYGSRAGRSAHEPVLIEVLQNDIYMASMKVGINYDLDATSCYDRILAAIASITSRSMGMNKHVVLVNAKTLQAAKFKLKTSLGISDAFYQHCTIYPIHGTGQGSGNSPQIWCFVCSVLFDALQATTSGATFFSFNGKESVTLHMVGFVDDCAQRTNDFQADPQPTAAILCAKMQLEAQAWNDLLFVSGGRLEIPKCSYHLSESEQDQHGTPRLKSGKYAPNIHIMNGLVPSQVKQKSNLRSHKTLGCHVNPGNRMQAQKEALKAKSDAYATIVATNVLKQKETRTMYTSMYLPAITYPFPVTSLTPSDCETIQHKFMQQIVPSLGYNRRMKLAVRYGMIKWGGAGLRQLYVEQGVQGVMMVLKHMRSPTGQPGKMLRIAVSWAQAYAGVSTFLWEDPRRPSPPHPARYIQSITKFLASIDAKILLPLSSDIVPPRLRVNDQHVMDLAMLQNYPPRIIERINACRRYLQAITIADIADEAGTRLLPGVSDGTRNPQRATMFSEKFNQPMPPTPAWLSWRKFLQTCIATAAGRLFFPLREWTVPHTRCRHIPEYIHNPTTDAAFRHHLHGKYKQMDTSPAQSGYIVNDDNLPIDVTGYPCQGHFNGVTCRILKNYVEQTPPGVYLDGTFAEYVASLADWESELLSTVELLETPHDIIQILNQAPFRTGTDGSVIKESATFGVVTATAAGRRLFTIRGAAPGSRPQSFRAEGYGGLAVVRFLIRLTHYTGINLTQPFQHFLDNTSVITRVSKALKRPWTSPNLTLAPEWDLIELIKTSYQELDHPADIKWVKGHQDNDRPRENLPLSAQLNCEADDQAGQYQTEHGTQPRPIGPFLPTTMAQLLIQGESVSSHYKTRIREAATLPPYFEYLEEKFHWDEVTRKEIDWPVYKQIIRSFPAQHTTLVKHLHKIAPTGEIAHRNNHHYPSECPSCDCEVETNDHVLLCSAISRQRWRSNSRTAVLNYVDRVLSSDPVLSDILRDGLTRWATQLPTPDPHEYPEAYHALIRSQNYIGWDHLFRARWSNQWQILHSHYAQRVALDSKLADGSAWVRKVGKKLLQQWFDLWAIRNTERHGKDIAEQKANRKAFLQSQLEELYSFRDATMPTDRHMFHQTAAIHLDHQTNLDHIESWINIWQPAILSSVKQAKALLQQLL